jgi:hypothetical protein
MVPPPAQRSTRLHGGRLLERIEGVQVRVGRIQRGNLLVCRGANRGQGEGGVAAVRGIRNLNLKGLIPSKKSGLGLPSEGLY